MSPAPPAGSASAAALYFSDGLGGQKALNRQYRFMVTGPTAFTLATTIDEQVANAVSAH